MEISLLQHNNKIIETFKHMDVWKDWSMNDSYVACLLAD